MLLQSNVLVLVNLQLVHQLSVLVLCPGKQSGKLQMLHITTFEHIAIVLSIELML